MRYRRCEEGRKPPLIAKLLGIGFDLLGREVQENR